MNLNHTFVQMLPGKGQSEEQGMVRNHPGNMQEEALGAEKALLVGKVLATKA